MEIVRVALILFQETLSDFPPGFRGIQFTEAYLGAAINGKIKQILDVCCCYLFIL